MIGIKNYRYSNLLSCWTIILLLYIFYKNFINVKDNDSDYSSTEHLENLKSFENQFYSIFENVEDYPYSNLNKDPKYRQGFKL